MTKFFFWLLFFFFPCVAAAQLNNAEAISATFLKWTMEKKMCFEKVEGLKQLAHNQICIDEDCKNKLSILPANVSYKRVAAQRFVRSIAVPIEFTISDSMKTENLYFTDTLSSKDLKIARKSSPKDLQGENPFFVARYVQPAAIIVGSMAVIVALFYIRSK